MKKTMFLMIAVGLIQLHTASANIVREPPTYVMALERSQSNVLPADQYQIYCQVPQNESTVHLVKHTGLTRDGWAKTVTAVMPLTAAEYAAIKTPMEAIVYSPNVETPYDCEQEEISIGGSSSKYTYIEGIYSATPCRTLSKDVSAEGVLITRLAMEYCARAEAIAR
jgi:hypothetical protein